MVSPAPTVTTEEKRAALTQALASHTFARSEQLKGFLKFVCEKAIAGKGEEINEYLIGVEVLSRPSDYSPNEDSAVRNRAYALRGKLEELYSHELPDARIRVELPKGSYCPEFMLHEPDRQPSLKTLPAADRPSLAPGSPESGRLSWPSILTGLLLGLLLAGAIWTASVLISPAKLNPTLAATSDSPELAELWRPVLQNDRPLILLFSSLQFQRYDNGFIRFLLRAEEVEWAERAREMVAFSNDGKFLAFGQRTSAEIHVWRRADWQLVAEQKLPGKSLGSNGYHRVTFAPDNKWLAAGFEDKAIRLWPLPERAVAEAQTIGSQSISRQRL
jgi:hypothetical protein